MCLNQCIHVEITEELIQQAELDNESIKRQKGDDNKSTILMTESNDFIGSLAQNSVFQYFDDVGIYIQKTSFFDKSIHQDECDFEHRGLNDIKGSPTTKQWNQVYPRSRFLLSDHQLKKEVDWYTFVKIDLEENIAHIAGVINYGDFMDKSEPFQSQNTKSPCHFILAKDLKPFRDYVFGV